MHAPKLIGDFAAEVTGAFGGGADGEGARREVVTDASVCVSVASGLCRILSRVY